MAWKPVLFVFIFAFAFIEFSKISFTDTDIANSDTKGIEKSISKRSINDLHLQSLPESSVLNSNPVPTRSKRKALKANSYDETGNQKVNHIRPLRSQFQRRLRKKSRSEAFHKPISSSYKRYKYITQQQQDEDYDYESNSDEEKIHKSSKKSKQNRARKRKKFDWKRKVSLVYAGPSNLSLVNPKRPLELPIVKPEMFDEEKSEHLIPTKSRPFHFHVPLVSKNPETKLTIDELLVIALQYKDPLTLDDSEVNTTNVTKSSLTVKQRDSIRRMVRDSPVLDFLNIAALVKKRSASGTDDDPLNKVNGSNGDLSSQKKEVIEITATDELLQEIVGDADDLVDLLEERLKARAALSDDIGQESENIDLFKTNGQESIDQNTIRRKRTQELLYDSIDANSFETLNSIRPKRVKRGLGSWLKKVFGKKTTTTTTTTKAPKKRKKKESSEESEKNSQQGKAIYFQLKVDSHGDTEVDKLLPVYLRRSSYLKRKHEEIPDKNKNPDSFEEGMDPDDKKKKRKTKRSISPAEFHENTLDFDQNAGNRFVRSTNFDQINTNEIIPVPPISKLSTISSSDPTELSKEGLKLIQEMFSNIVHDRCYVSISPVLLEKLQGTVSKVIDRSFEIKSDKNKNTTLIKEGLLQQLINCSSDPEKALEWKSQGQILKKSKSKYYTEFEQGASLQRPKRISLSKEEINYEYDYEFGFKNNPLMMVNLLVNLVKKMSQVVHIGCGDSINSELIQMASLLLENTLRVNFYLLDNFFDKTSMISGKEASELYKDLDICLEYPLSTVSTTSSLVQLKSDFSDMNKYNNYDNYLPVPLPAPAPVTVPLQYAKNYPYYNQNFYPSSKPNPNMNQQSQSINNFWDPLQSEYLRRKRNLLIMSYPNLANQYLPRRFVNL